MPILEHERRLILEYGRQMREFYPDRDWDRIEPFLRQLWEDNVHRLTRWEEAKDLMHQAWRAGNIGDAVEAWMATENEEPLVRE